MKKEGSPAFPLDSKKPKRRVCHPIGPEGGTTGGGAKRLDRLVSGGYRRCDRLSNLHSMKKCNGWRQKTLKKQSGHESISPVSLPG